MSVKTVWRIICSVLALLILLLLVNIVLVKPDTTPNPCDKESYYKAHYQQCDDKYVTYDSSYFWGGGHSNYQKFVSDSPIHPQYHPAGYYDSKSYYQSSYYKSGNALQGDGPHADEDTDEHPEYGGGGKDPGSRSGENGNFGSDGGDDSGHELAPGFRNSNFNTNSDEPDGEENTYPQIWSSMDDEE